MNDAPPILAVNSNQQNLNLLIQFLAKENYTTYPVKTLHAFDQALTTHMIFCMALIDITSFDQHIWSRCTQLQEHNVPFIIILPKHNASVQLMSLNHGARSVLIKPLVMRELQAIIHSLLGE